MTGGEVRAAGCLVWRHAGDGDVEVLVVHRPRYDDWSFPKGKAAPGEPAEECARRELREETGFEVRLGAELASTCYRDRNGMAKTVRYWAATRLGGHFTPNDEVDEIRWMPPARLGRLLTYSRDVEVLRSLRPNLGLPSIEDPSG